jgi:hypothetical protein
MLIVRAFEAHTMSELFFKRQYENGTCVHEAHHQVHEKADYYANSP